MHTEGGGLGDDCDDGEQTFDQADIVIVVVICCLFVICCVFK